MKEYYGRFPVCKGLTKKLNYGAWFIYRDPEYGLYAHNSETNDDVSLMDWNCTISEVTEKRRAGWIDDIERCGRDI